MDQIIAAEDMAPAARASMIEGMVSSLSNRLATQGGTAEEWAQLIVATSVLERTTEAREILVEARDVFGSSEESLALIEAAAARAGLEE